MSARLWTIALALGALVACASEDRTEEALLPQDPEQSPTLAPLAGLAPPSDHTALEGERASAGDVDLTPTPNATSRNLRRMSVAQLQAAIRVATGGLTWHDAQGRDQLDRLAPTLGVPNYIDTTHEDLDASLVFQKFLGDGVRAVCDEAIQDDLDMHPDDRIMIRHVDPTLTWEAADEAGRQAIDRNLRAMKLRITGHNVDLDDPEGLSRLRWLFRSASHATGSPAKGWRAVCVGLMSSPEFYLY